MGFGISYTILVGVGPPGCGHAFCKSCIENVKSPCPMCRDEKFVTFPNNQLDREIKNLDIFCTNVERGCIRGKVSMAKLVSILEFVNLRKQSVPMIVKR